MSYNVESQIGGKLAQLGQRLINSAAKKTADDFFEKFRTAVATGSTGRTATSTQTVIVGAYTLPGIAPDPNPTAESATWTSARPAQSPINKS